MPMHQKNKKQWLNFRAKQIVQIEVLKWFIHCRTGAKILVLPYCYGRLFFFAHCLIRVTTFAFNPSTNYSI